VRDRTGLLQAEHDVAFWCRYVLAREFDSRAGWELQNLLTIARLMIWAALQRTESRGTHYRSDYPERNDAQWLRHLTCPATLPQQPSPEGIYALRTFASPKVRQEHPGQVVEVLRGLPVHLASGVPVLVVVGEEDIPSIRSASEDLVSSLAGAELVSVTEGMVLEADEPPDGFGAYLKHWVNHGSTSNNRAVAMEVVAFTEKALRRAPAEGGTSS